MPRIDYTRTGMYQALKVLREQAKIDSTTFPKSVYTQLEAAGIPGQPDKTFQKFRPWYYRIKEDLFNAVGEEKAQTISDGVISGVPPQVTPNATRAPVAAVPTSSTRSIWELSDDEVEDSMSDVELMSGGLDLRKHGRMTTAKRQKLLNNDVKKMLTFVPFHFCGVFEDFNSSLNMIVVIHLPSGVDSTTFKPTVKGNLLEIEMKVPALMTRGDLLFGHMAKADGASLMTRLVNFKTFLAKCLGQKKPGDAVYAHSKIYLPAPALDNKFIHYDETQSDDGATVVTIEMLIEETYIEGKVVAKKKAVKL